MCQKLRHSSVFKMKIYTIRYAKEAGNSGLGSEGRRSIRKGYWRVARNPIIAKAISAERLKKAGYINFLDYYESVCA